MFPADESERVARLLVDYWRVHPLASDTADGIRQWWLGGAAVSRPALQRALQSLRRQGLVEAVAAADGRLRYHWAGRGSGDGNDEDRGG